MSSYFAGLDWASHTHAVCVIDERGAVVERFEITHDAPGLADLLRRLRRLGSPPVAIERPSGLLVDTLVEAGFTVVPIHPNAVKASRPRYRSHGGKSDASDAYLLADLLRTDGHRFKALAPQGDEILALRALVRGRDDLVATRVQLANQLRSLLESFWPGAACIFADIDSPIALAFVERYPTPESAKALGPKRMAAFCAQHAYCGRRSADDLLARLHDAAPAVCAELQMEAKGELVRSPGRTPAHASSSRSSCSHAARASSASLDDGQIVMGYPMSFRGRASAPPRSWPSSAACASASQAMRNSPPRPASLRSPTSRASPRRSPSAGPATTACAPPSLAWPTTRATPMPGLASVYAAASARGCDHPHAIRILARAWLRVIWRC